MQSPSWPAVRVEKLKSLWIDGHSATDIGKMFSISRNAVMGKVSRLGLAATDRVNYLSDQETIKKRAAWRLEKQLARMRGPTGLRREKIKTPPAPPVEPLNLKIIDLNNSTCRFIQGEPGIETLYCGHPVKGESTYCAFHHGLCYRPYQKRNRRRATASRFSFESPSIVPTELQV